MKELNNNGDSEGLSWETFDSLELDWHDIDFLETDWDHWDKADLVALIGTFSSRIREEDGPLYKFLAKAALEQYNEIIKRQEDAALVASMTSKQMEQFHEKQAKAELQLNEISDRTVRSDEKVDQLYQDQQHQKRPLQKFKISIGNILIGVIGSALVQLLYHIIASKSSSG